MRKTSLFFGLFMGMACAQKGANAQFAPAHSKDYLDTRRDDELKHRDMARMLMSMGMNSNYTRPPVMAAVSAPPTAFQPLPSRQIVDSPVNSSVDARPRGYENGAFMALPDAPDSLQIPAVVQVNREIGLSMTGSWANYKEKGLYAGPFTGYDREAGWIPGFQADAAVMFDTYEIEHLFLAAHFALGDGSVSYKGSASDWAGRVSPFNSTSDWLTTDTRIEVGKGIMVNDRFMITPALEGGYWSWERTVAGSKNVQGSREVYGGFMAGVMVHLDYAPTDSFVLRGRLGWVELVGTRMDARGQDGTFHLRPRPEWDAALGFDYRLLAALHWTAEIQYNYRSFGRSQFLPYKHELCCIYEPSSWSNGVKLRTGLAYAF